MKDYRLFDFRNKNENPWPNARLENAVIIGHTTSNSAKLWVRTKEQSECLLCIIPVDDDDKDLEKKLNELVDSKYVWSEESVIRNKSDIELSVEHKKTFETKLSKDCTFAYEFTGLKSGQRYRYFLAVKETEKDGESDVYKVIIDAIPGGLLRDSQKHNTGSAGLSFWTLDESGENFKFGLFSCHNPYVALDDDSSNSITSGKNDDKLHIQVKLNEDDNAKALEIKNMSSWNFFNQTLFDLSNDDNGRLSFVIAGGDQCYTDGHKKINIWDYLYKVMDREPSDDDMLSWYRDIYHGYWGFKEVRSVYGMYPTYMIWDDHEICDGWGSYLEYKENMDDDIKKCHPIYEKIKEKRETNPSYPLKVEDGTKLLERMFNAACKVYDEYQHSHNPNPYLNENKRHYHFQYGRSHFFVMDGRGHRNINGKYKILGEEQFNDFENYVKNTKKDDNLFIASAVPMIHVKSIVTEKGGNILNENADDLRDSWEHPDHEEEKSKVMNILWAAADRGVRVCILSGDVHASALFNIYNEKKQKTIYQITSSAITYHMPFFMRVGARFIAANNGNFDDDSSKFERKIFYSRSSYATIQVKGNDVIVTFHGQDIGDKKYENENPKFQQTSKNYIPPVHSPPKKNNAKEGWGSVTYELWKD